MAAADFALHFDRAASTRCVAIVPAVSKSPDFMSTFAILSDTSQAHPSAKLNAMTLSGRRAACGRQIRHSVGFGFRHFCEQPFCEREHAPL
jgi:hypothetical protein